MKVKSILYLLIPIACYSCKSKTFNISPNEDKGIKEVLSVYGGNCEYGINMSVSTSEGKNTTFWLKLTKSAEVDSFRQIPELPVSNLAFLFYKNLKAETKNYSTIRTEIHFENGNVSEGIYKTSDLEKVKQKLWLVNRIVADLKTKNFAAVKKYIHRDSSIIDFDVQKLISNIPRVESEFGEIQDVIPLGFKFTGVSNKQVLHITVFLKRSKQSTYFNVNLDPESEKDEIYSLNYQL